MAQARMASIGAFRCGHLPGRFVLKSACEERVFFSQPHLEIPGVECKANAPL